MALVEVFAETFNDSTIDLVQESNNGYIYKPTRTSLAQYAAAGVNCDVWNTTFNGPISYKLFADYIPASNMLVAEGRLTSYIYSATTCMTGLIIYKDHSNWQTLCFYPGDVHATTDRTVAGSSAGAGWADITHPNRTPNRYRIYYNVTGSTQTITVDSRSLSNNNMAFYFSGNDGTTWTYLTTSATFGPLVAFGIFSKSWATFPSFTANWDYLKIYQGNPGDTAAFSDDFDNSTIDISSENHNGSQIEYSVADTSLVQWSTAQSTDSWNTTFNCPIVYKTFASYDPSSYMLSGEIRITSVVVDSAYDNDDISLSIIAYKDHTNWYKLVLDFHNKAVDCFRTVSGSSSTPSWTSNYRDPNAIPIRFRIYYNGTSGSKTITVDSRSLSAGHIAFYYSLNDGTTWTYLYEEVAGFAPTAFGITSGNGWSQYWGYIASFDYLKIYQDNDTLVFTDDFSDGVVGLSVENNKGFSKESTGGLFHYGRGTDNTYMWGATYNSPTVYKTFSAYSPSIYMLCCESRLPTTCNVANAGSIEPYSLLAYKDKTNWYRITFNRLYIKIGASKTVSGSSSLLVNEAYGVPASPNDSTNRYRIYYNGTSSVQTIEVDSRSLSAGHIAFYYSLDDGTTWTYLYEEVAGFAPTAFALAAGRANLNMAFANQWSYLKIYQSIIDPDPPTLQNQSPADAAANVSKDTSIYLEIVDTGVDATGVNISATVITINGTVAWTGDAVQSGFTGSKSAIADGYSYTLTPTSSFSSGQVVSVEVDAADLSGNVLNETYSFTIEIDTTRPYLANINPSDGEQNVSTTQTISFSIRDDFTITQSTIVISANSITVYSGSSFQNGYSGSCVANAYNGYDFTISAPSAGWPVDAYTVFNVFASDGFNSTNESFSFNTGTPHLGYKFNVSSIQTIREPSPLEFWNQYDEHGLVLAAPRKRSETNWEYRRRLKDTFANIANASYRGLINGITREFNLSLYNAISINPKVNSSGNFLAASPYVKFDGAYLYLYSDYENDLLDYQIDRYEKGGNYEDLGRLTTLINTTTYFEASLISGIDQYTRSMAILNQSNRERVDKEIIPISTKFALENSKPISGSVFFSDRYIFATEVDTEVEVNRKGTYYIDYNQGFVRVYNLPSADTIVRYEYTVYPFTAKASPVILHDIGSDNFKVKMFNQILQEDGTYEHGLPTDIGMDIILELLSVGGLYYGI